MGIKHQIARIFETALAFKRVDHLNREAVTTLSYVCANNVSKLMHWHKSHKGLPEFGVLCVVEFENEEIMTAMIIKDGAGKYWWGVCGTGDWYETDRTHWLPVPPRSDYDINGLVKSDAERAGLTWKYGSELETV